MSAQIYTLSGARFTQPPTARSNPDRVIVIGFIQDKCRVCTLWGGTPSRAFPDYERAREYAVRLSRQHGWRVANFLGEAA